MGALSLLLLLFFSLFGVAKAPDPIADPSILDTLPEPDNPLYRYLKTRISLCQGDGATLAPPVELVLAGRTFVFDGPTLARKDPDRAGTLVLGLLGAIKDFAEPTRQALDAFFARFTAEKIDALLLLGDLAGSEMEMSQILLYSAKPGWPVLSLIGNSESRSAFNRAHLAALKVAPAIINLDLIRRVDLGPAVLVSQPGYMDRRFMHQASGCTYQPADVAALKGWVEGAAAPVLLVGHGPPAGQGEKALDRAVEAGNVGDPTLAKLIAERGIPFGAFSHILEAGGRAVDGQGRLVAAGHNASQLYLNVGSANPLPWQLNGGKQSCGMGAILKIQGGKASVTWIERPCPKP